MLIDEPEVAEAREVRAGGIDYGPLDQRLGYLLRRAQIAVFQDFFAAFEAFDIRPAQYSVLTVIEQNPGLSQTQVAEALGIKKANFVAMIKALEHRGLAVRKSMTNDRRAFSLHLTKHGVALMAKMHAASTDHEERIRQIVGDSHYRNLFASLKALAK